MPVINGHKMAWSVAIHKHLLGVTNSFLAMHVFAVIDQQNATMEIAEFS